MNCVVCGAEIYTSPDSVRCFGCASGYKSLKPSSRSIVPSDCVHKSILTALVEEWQKQVDQCGEDCPCTDCACNRTHIEEVKQLLKEN